MRASQQRATGSLGFTLPELLVSIFIIALMTSIGVVGWHAGAETLALDRAAHKLAQDIRKATELAQRAQFFDCDPSKTLGYAITGYGIYVSSSTPTLYTLYIECSGNQEYTAGVDAVFETVVLENRIQITSPGSLSVFFVPPVPTITIQPGNLTEAQIILSVAGDSTRFKTITITTKGIIDID